MSALDRSLAALAALLLLAAGARLSGADQGPRVEWPEVPALAATPADPADGAASREVALAGNVFSAARAAPSVRFDPLAPEPQAEAAPPPPPPPPPRYRVAGTILDGAGGIALIDADPGTPGPEVYRVGAAVGGYRLERVEYDHVVLVGAAGEVRMEVAKPGEIARAAPGFTGPPPNARKAPDSLLRPRARSSENTPPGAIPPGW